MLSDDALEELNRVWTVARIFSSTAHDVNNALQVISGSAELVEAREGLDPIVLRRVQAIRNQTERATEAIDRLLRYARHAAGAAGTIDLAPLVESAVAMRSFTLNRASIAIECTRSDEEPYRTTVEPRAMLQVLLTLLLFFEKSLASRAPARIGVRIERAPSSVVVRLTSEAKREPAEGDGDPWAGDSLARGQLAAVRSLINRQGGTIALDADDVLVRSAVITLPSS